ncbi:pilus assembly PilX family protein [Massilia sp. S19_KUP03_FR1]|uniref:pilus assembly PilX family protein n=1 Tax=Massilia sp. S19_KUP03_FR1 TaxID=3025503 RepID=UPI002FCD2AA1
MRQRGAALVSALVLMVAVLIIAFSSVHAALSDAHSARHERDRQVALRAAEAALLDAERDVADTPATAPRFAALAGPGFIDGCGKAGSDNHGLCTRAAPPSWQVIDLAGDDAALVAYGTFTMRDLPGVAQQPRYLIEMIPLSPVYGRFYRITALGFGQRTSTRVVLQSFYRKAPVAGVPAAGAPATPPPATPPPAAGPPTTLPAGRIGWREVANWPALHAAVK